MNTLLRRRMMMALAAEGGKNEMIEPFYSDYPELTETGVYILTPQTEETASSPNLFVKLGDTNVEYVGSATINSSYTVVIFDRGTRVLLNSILDIGKGLQRTNAEIEQKATVKMKRCMGSEASEPAVTFYVEQIF